jgi:hypothetical protein
MIHFLKKEIELIKFDSVPEEMLNEDEIKEILQIEKEMESGERINLEDVFKEI